MGGKMMPPIDKQAHFFSGAALCFTLSLFIPVVYSIVIVVVAGAAKEIWDSTGRGTVDFWDGVATGFGGVFAASVTWIAEVLK